MNSRHQPRLPAFLHIALLCVGTTLFGVGSAPAQEDVRPFVFNLGAEPRTLDPGKSTTIDAAVVIQNAFEGLTRPLPDGSIAPGAAESWEISEDGRTYTFHLREDARWSNGDPVTAQDFAYAWRRVLEPEFAAEYAYVHYIVEGAQEYNEGRGSLEDVAVEAVDNRTLRVTLTGPAPYFLAFLDHAAFLPVHPPTVEKHPTWALSAATYVSNGPYRIETIDPKQRIVIVPNEHYRDSDKIGLRKVVFRQIVDNSTVLLEFRNGRIHGNVSRVPVPDVEQLRREGLLKVMPNLGTYFVCFNVTAPPFDNRDVRKAFTLALNRRLLVRLLKTGEEPAKAFVPPGIVMPNGEDFRDHYGDFFRDADLVGAKQALAKAGYPDGRGLPAVTYIYNTDDKHKLIAEFAQNAWKEVLGATVRLQNMEWKVLTDARTQGNFQFSRHGWIGDYPDPLTFLDMWTTGAGNNDADWSNEEYDRLIAAARREVDPMQRMEYFAEAESILFDEFVICPIYYYVQDYLETDKVEGIERSVMMTIRFDRARWVE